MIRISSDFTGGPGILVSTDPAADHSCGDVRYHLVRKTDDNSRFHSALIRTPDDAFSGTFRFKPLLTGAAAGRGGASSAALPNMLRPGAIAIGAEW